MPSKNTIVQLNDELLFLIACCQIDPSEDEINFILSYLNSEHLELNALISLANQHGILPLVYKTIKNLSENDNFNTEHLTLNAEILTELKAHYMSISQRNMLMSAELIRIMKLLDENGIEALAFKGPSLAQMAYGDITLRQYVDLDILIYEKDIEKVLAIMERKGYETALPAALLDDRNCRDILTDFVFVNHQNKTNVEIHWRMMEKNFQMNIEIGQILPTASSIEINHFPIRTISNEILIVYLAMHGAKHGWERLGWLYDINRLVLACGDGIDWDLSLTLAKETGGHKAFLVTLSTANELFHTPLPDIIQQQLDNPTIRTLTDLTIRMVTEYMQKEGVKHKLHLQDYRYQIIDRKMFRWWYNLTSLFTLSYLDCKDTRLPHSLKFLYYLLRLKRLLKNNLL